MKLLLHAVAITVIQCGIFLWVGVADWDDWADMYYVWDKLVMLLLVLCCINPVKAMRPFWILIGALFAVRLAGEFVAVFDVIFDFKLLFLINLLCTALVIRNVLKCPK